MMNQLSTNSRSARHPGLTLVELLVVMGVLSVLAAIALPNIRTMIKQQRLSRSAAAVQVYIDGARAKAIGDGQPYGIVIERLGLSNATDRSQSTLLRYAYSPPAYTGDVPDAAAIILPSGNLAFSPMHAPTLVAAARQMQTNSTLRTEPVVQPGDFITLGSVGVTVPILGIRYATSADFAFANADRNLIKSPGFVNANGNSNQYWPRDGVPSNAQVADWPVIVLSTPSTFDYDAAARIRRVLNPGSLTQFSITRRPRASIMPPLEMTEGTVIDLNYSGVGIGNALFSPVVIQGDASASSPAFVTGDRDYGSVTIMFDPAGSVSQVRMGTAAGDGSIVSLDITSNIFLLVGRTGNVRPGDSVDGITGTNGPLGQDSFGVANILDLESVWIVINRQTGEIYTATANELPRNADGSLNLPGATPLEKLSNAIIASQDSAARYLIGGSK